MIGDILTLESNSTDGTAWLVFSTAGQQQRRVLWLRKGFTLQDVTDAILATGWVRWHGDELTLTSEVDYDHLRNVVETMLGYFDSSGIPGCELLEIQSAVAEYESVRERGNDIPLFAFAWLDVMVREDLADEAQGANRIWLQSQVHLDISNSRDRRVAEVAARYAGSAAVGNIHAKLAPSRSTRPTDQSRTRIG